jgi:hypothetical protein
MTGSMIPRDRCDTFLAAMDDDVNWSEGVMHGNGEHIVGLYGARSAGKPASRV